MSESLSSTSFPIQIFNINGIQNLYSSSGNFSISPGSIWGGTPNTYPFTPFPQFGSNFNPLDDSNCSSYKKLKEKFDVLKDLFITQIYQNNMAKKFTDEMIKSNKSNFLLVNEYQNDINKLKYELKQKDHEIKKLKAIVKESEEDFYHESDKLCLSQSKIRRLEDDLIGENMEYTERLDKLEQLIKDLRREASTQRSFLTNELQALGINPKK